MKITNYTNMLIKENDGYENFKTQSISLEDLINWLNDYYNTTMLSSSSNETDLDKSFHAGIFSVLEDIKCFIDNQENEAHWYDEEV